MCTELIHSTVQQKLGQHCKNIENNKIKYFKNYIAKGKRKGAEENGKNVLSYLIIFTNPIKLKYPDE